MRHAWLLLRMSPAPVSLMGVDWRPARRCGRSLHPKVPSDVDWGLASLAQSRTWTSARPGQGKSRPNVWRLSEEAVGLVGWFILGARHLCQCAGAWFSRELARWRSSQRALQRMAAHIMRGTEWGFGRCGEVLAVTNLERRVVWFVVGASLWNPGNQTRVLLPVTPSHRYIRT